MSIYVEVLVRGTMQAMRCAAVLMAVTIALGLALPRPTVALDRDEFAAAKTAEAWLVLVDQHRYAESWDAAAVFFKEGVDRTLWAEALRAVREPLGKLLFRRLKAAESRVSIPRAPDGKYVTIQYEASFEKNKTAVETVTSMQEEDGSWKVIGYLVR